MQKKYWPLSLVLVVLCGLSQSQAIAEQGGRDFYRAPSSFAGKTVVIPIGTMFEGRIQSTIGSRASRSGDSFSVEVSAPVLANGTEVLIPSGSEIIGEVAEAISSSSQPHDKNMYPPLGILRVQITSLKLPDGTSYPLVASFAPDGARGRSHGGNMTARKSGVAYVGTQAGFDAVNPALQPRNGRSGQGQAVLKRGDILRDPILGDAGGQTATGQQLRALVRKGRELFILKGSSMTIRLDGPLKIAFGASNAQNSMESQTPDEPVATKGKRFSKSRPAAAPDNSQEQQQGGDMAGQQQQRQQQQGGNPQQGGQQPVGQTPPAEQPGSSF